jgi:hypothetical protein
MTAISNPGSTANTATTKQRGHGQDDVDASQVPVALDPCQEDGWLYGNQVGIE